MATYSATARTNYFRVTDEEKYQELFSKLVSDDEIEDFTEIKDGITYHGFGAYAPVEYLDNDEYEYDFDIFLEKLQKILPKDEAFMYFEVGNEKLRFLTGYACVVTHDKIKEMNLDNWAKKVAKNLLGKNFTTKTNY